MGYFKRLADSSFKVDDQGNTLFYPWGILGRGYILPDKETETEIRRFITRYHYIGLTLVFIIGPFLMLWGVVFALLLPITLLIWWIQAKRVIKNLKQTEEKLTIKENIKKMFGNENS